MMRHRQRFSSRFDVNSCFKQDLSLPAPAFASDSLVQRAAQAVRKGQFKTREFMVDREGRRTKKRRFESVEYEINGLISECFSARAEAQPTSNRGKYGRRLMYWTWNLR
jgi:hypothetical protein